MRAYNQIVGAIVLLCGSLKLAHAAGGKNYAGRPCTYDSDCAADTCKDLDGKKVCGGCKYDWRDTGTFYGCSDCSSNGESTHALVRSKGVGLRTTKPILIFLLL